MSNNTGEVDMIDVICEVYGMTREELIGPIESASIPMTMAPVIDPEILEESALCMAQATIQNAITKSGLSRAELARRLGTSRSYITSALRGDSNMTIKTMARLLLACGYEIRFEAVPCSPSCSYVNPHG